MVNNRERILDILADGKRHSTMEIAQKLNLKWRIVASHLSHLKGKVWDWQLAEPTIVSRHFTIYRAYNPDKRVDRWQLKSALSRRTRVIEWKPRKTRIIERHNLPPFLVRDMGAKHQRFCKCKLNWFTPDGKEIGVRCGNDDSLIAQTLEEP